MDLDRVSLAFLLLAAPCVGSFLGTVIERLPAGEPIALGRSRCQFCRQDLSARDLVPVASWIARRGRCRHCRERIGLFHPTIELSALAVGVTAAAAVPASALPASLALGWTLLALAVIDTRHFLLPDRLTLPLLLAGLSVAAFGDQHRLVDAVLGAAFGYASLACAAGLYRRARGREGLGLGDAKLFAALGAWVGWQGLPGTLLIACLAALVAALIAGRGRPAATMPIPFGPWLALGGWTVWLIGPLVPA